MVSTKKCKIWYVILNMASIGFTRVTEYLFLFPDFNGVKF